MFLKSKLKMITVNMKLSRESQVSPRNLGSQGIITSARLSIGCEESRSSCDIPTWDP